MRDEDVNRYCNEFFIRHILHVHGSLGSIFSEPEFTADLIYLPYENNPDLSQGKFNTYAETLGRSSAQIKIIHEQNAANVTPRIANFYSDSPNQIIFLGFGFHGENVEILPPETSKKHFSIYPCFYGMKSAEIHQAYSLLPPYMQTPAKAIMTYISPHNENSAYQTHKCNDFLRSFVSFS
jgi:hypothetical protein